VRESESETGLVGPRRRAPRWAVSAVGLVLATVLLEVAARLEGVPVCGDAQGVFLESDEEVGWTFTPGQTFRVTDCRGRAWSAPVTINHEGLADQPRPFEKRPGSVRVLLLGGQLADGLGVARRDRLSVRLAHLADQTRGARLSVVNALVPGYGPPEALRWLERRGLRYEPDVVVLVLDPSRDAEPQRGSIRTLDADIAPASGLVPLSAIAQWVAGRPGVMPRHPVAFVPPATRAVGRGQADASGRATAHARTQREIASLAETAQRAGAGFAVLIAPPCPSVAYEPDLCAALAGDVPCTDLGATFDGLRRDAKRPLELCIDPLGRWGRDGHFLASHALWDLLAQAKLWPETVVRGYRL